MGSENASDKPSEKDTLTRGILRSAHWLIPIIATVVAIFAVSDILGKVWPFFEIIPGDINDSRPLTMPALRLALSVAAIGYWVKHDGGENIKKIAMLARALADKKKSRQ